MSEYTEETPEWVIVSGEVRTLVRTLRKDVQAAVERFRGFDDVRDAIDFRARQVPRLRGRVEDINKRIRYLNLIAPLPRFHAIVLRVDEEVAPLERAYFTPP